MTFNEASERFHIGIDVLREYKEKGFLENANLPKSSLELTETDVQRIALIGFLQRSGMDAENLKSYLRLIDDNSGNHSEQIRILRKQRCKLLEEIHEKQRILDELDYMILEAKK